MPGIDGGLACRVLALTGGQDLAHDHFVDLLPASTLARRSAPVIAGLAQSCAGPWRTHR